MSQAERESLSAGLAVQAQNYRDRMGLSSDSLVIVKVPHWCETVLSGATIENVRVEFDLFDRSAKPERWVI